ncbi:MAG: orotate phosphoribosyltransferase [candidate division NC10 bacterium]|nr:orotate phosphoribosyltransferase [candidate division NC10 bacterium]MBI2563576.1 orotate phosphoribosyltransferase [candidate division NC10 bacterium]MBI3087150.1 orotate phosphoribosyltransferase [candidate division NC10 bacterium]
MLGEADRKLVEDLFAIQALKFGEFRLKSGVLSPFYVDLRGIIAHPPILQAVALRILDILRPLRLDRIAGIPYAGLPIATAVALAGNLPMLYARKEVKDHGTRRAIEGTFTPGEVVVLIDDVITDGASKFEAAAPFLEAGLVVKDFVIFLDREQGGADRLREKGYALHSALKISAVLVHLRDAGRLTPEQFGRCMDFIATVRF